MNPTGEVTKATTDVAPLYMACAPCVIFLLTAWAKLLAAAIPLPIPLRMEGGMRANACFARLLARLLNALPLDGAAPGDPPPAGADPPEDGAAGAAGDDAAPAVVAPGIGALAVEADAGDADGEGDDAGPEDDDGAGDDAEEAGAAGEPDDAGAAGAGALPAVEGMGALAGFAGAGAPAPLPVFCGAGAVGWTAGAGFADDAPAPVPPSGCLWDSGVGLRDMGWLPPSGVFGTIFGSLPPEEADADGLACLPLLSGEGCPVHLLGFPARAAASLAVGTCRPCRPLWPAGSIGSTMSDHLQDVLHSLPQCFHVRIEVEAFHNYRADLA